MPANSEARPASAPAVPQPAPLGSHEPLLRLKDVKFRFGQRLLDAQWSFDLYPGERLGLLAPSGAGKSTLARAILGLVEPAMGSVERFGAQTSNKNGPMSNCEVRSLWRRIQLVPQDTDMTFDPASLVGEALGQAWQVADPALSKAAAWQHSENLFAEVHLPARLLHAPPQLLSGGERRRAAVACRLAALGYLLPQPTTNLARVLIVDEPTVGLDEFMQAKLAAVLLQAAAALDLTYLVISHDWRFVERFCTRSTEPQTDSSGSRAA
jgi:peptide/nickel transport system ATP-binding protein